jgi:hypothetical protein
LYYELPFWKYIAFPPKPCKHLVDKSPLTHLSQNLAQCLAHGDVHWYVLMNKAGNSVLNNYRRKKSDREYMKTIAICLICRYIALTFDQVCSKIKSF